MRPLLLSALLASPLLGQDLLEDINTSVSAAGSTSFGSSVALAAKVLFAANDSALGWEPHVIDASGARPLLDLHPGPNGSHPEFHTVFAGEAIFAASGTQGPGIWRSNGSAGGTQLFANLVPISRIVPWKGAVWFWTRSAPSGLSLWKSNATAGGNVLVTTLPDIARGSLRLFALPERLITLAGSAAIFSDGTGAGTSFTQRLWDVQPMDACVAGNLLYFAAGSSKFGIELWRSDATEGGTFQCRDAAPDLESSSPQSLVALGDQLVFSALEGTTRRLWISDGSGVGTRVLGASGVGSEIVSSGKRVYFSASQPGNGTELWTSDGTPAGTREVANINPTGDSLPKRLFFVDDRIHFSADDGTRGREPWSSDGTVAGTRLVADIRPGAPSSMPDALPATSSAFVASLGGRAHFGADDGVHGYEIWRADANATSVALLADLNPRLTADARIEQLVVRDREAFFVARDATGLAIWRTDGTRAGTRVAIRHVPLPLASIEGLQLLGNRLVFRAQELAPGATLKLFASDGTEAGTTSLASCDPYRLQISFGSTVYRGRLWFTWYDAAHGTEPWSTDGTVGGTVHALDLTPGPTDSKPTDYVVAGGKLFFASSRSLPAFEGKIWSSDGTPGGTTEIASGGLRMMSRPQALGNLLVYHEPLTGLMRSDGTAAGTFLLDATANLDGAVFAGRYWYAIAGSGGGGNELRSTDATVAGTRREVAFPPVNNVSTSIGSIAVGTDRLFFSLYTGTTGQELWSTDGTPGSAALVREIAPGTQNGTSGPFVNLTANQRLLFPGFDPLLGTELFVSDGTGSGTRQVADVNPGPGFSSPKLFTRLGRQLLFVADDGIHGAELFAMDLAKIGGAVAAPFGTPCGATAPTIGALGAPTLGSFGFWLSLTNAPQNAPLVWVLGGSRQDVPLYGCTFHVGGPWLARGGATSAAGEAVLAVPIPADPRLLGSDLYAQAVVADASWFTFSGGMQVLVGAR